LHLRVFAKNNVYFISNNFMLYITERTLFKIGNFL